MTLVASNSTSFTRYWFLTIDTNVAEIPGKTDYLFVSNFIEKTLSDPKGWNRFGYIFFQISPIDGINLRKNEENNFFVFHIHLSQPTTIRNMCDLPNNLSCADLSKNIIFFNVDRWINGSKESGLSLSDYRVMLTNHEIGHLLNRNHNMCSKNVNDSCPVMYQQTISKGCCKPNKYPLDWE